MEDSSENIETKFATLETDSEFETLIPLVLEDDNEDNDIFTGYMDWCDFFDEEEKERLERETFTPEFE